jgi:hemerythrin-like domain-containing protein
MDLILQLREEHRQILRLFVLIKTNLESEKSDVRELGDQLMELKELLISHLALEDKLLYPKLVKSKSPEIKKTGQMFSKEMAEIAKKTMIFFRKYEKIQFDKLITNKTFSKEIEKVAEKIKRRVSIEESILYNAYLTAVSLEQKQK